MASQLFALLILVPFFGVFVYAIIHEYLRFKSDGPATYGLVYDEESGTTHVSGLGEDVEAYDPDEFDPNAWNEQQADSASDEEKSPTGPSDTAARDRT